MLTHRISATVDYSDDIETRQRSQREYNLPSIPSHCKFNIWYIIGFGPKSVTRSSAIAEGPRDALSVEILSIAAQLYEKSKGMQQVGDLEGHSRLSKLPLFQYFCMKLTYVAQNECNSTLSDIKWKYRHLLAWSMSVWQCFRGCAISISLGTPF